MSASVADITMSLDGFVTGPDPDLEHGLGHGAERLHDWVFAADDEIDKIVLAESTAATGAVVMGRRTFDFVDGPNGWTEEEGYAPGNRSFRPPVFVVTHTAPRITRLTTQFTFVTGGLAAAISAARDAAGTQNVSVMGGADVVRQAVRLGLVTQLRVHIAPLLLGSGTRLFEGGPPQELTQERVQVSAHATHVTYRVGATNGH